MQVQQKVFRNTAKHPWTYEDLNQYQRALSEAIRQKTKSPQLIFSEVAPVITVGRRGGCQSERDDFTLPIDQIQSQGVSVLETGRGGLATYHGPGQWVVFFIVSLRQLFNDSRALKPFVTLLLETGLGVAKRYDSTAEIREKTQAGVWGEQGKIVSIGLSVDRGVVQHGIAMNGYRTETSFYGIKPCGLDAKPQFLLESLPAGLSEIEKANAFNRLREEIFEEFQRKFKKLSVEFI